MSQVAVEAIPGEAVVTPCFVPQRRSRPKNVKGWTPKYRMGCGSLYITVNWDENGEIYEVFISLGKAGHCTLAQGQAIARSVSIALQYGIPVSVIIKQFSGIQCPSQAWQDGQHIYSCADAIAKALRATHEMLHPSPPEDEQITNPGPQS